MTTTSTSPTITTPVRYAEEAAKRLAWYATVGMHGQPQQVAEVRRIRRDLGRLEEPTIGRAVFEAECLRLAAGPLPWVP